MSEPTGWIKIMYNESVIMKEFYYTKNHRKRLFKEYIEFIKVRKKPMRIHIIPKIEGDKLTPKESVAVLPAQRNPKKRNPIIPDVKSPIVRPPSTYSNQKSLYGER